MILMGVGGGLSFPALAMLAMADATPADSGTASGLLNTTAQVGGALGIAVLATVSTSRTTGLLADGVSTGPALSAGYHLAWAIGAGLVLVSLILAVALLRPATTTAVEEPIEDVEVPA
jgi:MFS family permease